MGLLDATGLINVCQRRLAAIPPVGIHSNPRHADISSLAVNKNFTDSFLKFQS